MEPKASRPGPPSTAARPSRPETFPSPVGWGGYSALSEMNIGEGAMSSRVDEVEDDADEPHRMVVLRKVPDALQHVQDAARHGLVSLVGMSNGNDRVSVPPNDERRPARDEAQAVHGAHSLAARVHHRMESVEEGAASVSIQQRTIPPPELLERGRGLQADLAEPPHHRRPGGLQPRVEGGRDQVLDAREAERSKVEGDLLAQTSAPHQDEPLAAIWELVRKLHDHPATEGVTDEGGPVVAQLVHQVPDPGGQRTKGV